MIQWHGCRSALTWAPRWLSGSPPISPMDIRAAWASTNEGKSWITKYLSCANGSEQIKKQPPALIPTMIQLLWKGTHLYTFCCCKIYNHAKYLRGVKVRVTRHVLLNYDQIIRTGLPIYAHCTEYLATPPNMPRQSVNISYQEQIGCLHVSVHGEFDWLMHW